LALRWSIEQGDIKWESDLVSAHHTFVATVGSVARDVDRADELGSAHGALHHAMVAACGSPHLLEMRATLFSAAELYRRWTLYRTSVHRDVLTEHRALVDACLERQVARATSLMSAHIELTADLVLETLSATEPALH
jgi:DNA-binding GntR family transcriptional regulator